MDELYPNQITNIKNISYKFREWELKNEQNKYFHYYYFTTSLSKSERIYYA